MWQVIGVLTSYFFVYIFLRLFYNKTQKSTITLIILSQIFFISIFFIYFFVIKFNGDTSITIFPDEITYLYGQSTGYFGKFIQIIVDTTSITFMRSLNIFCYGLGIAMLIMELAKDNKTVRGINYILILGISCLGSYWSFFILKEAMSILGICIYLIGYKRKNNILKSISIMIFFVCRMEIALLLIISEILFGIYKKSRRFFFLTLICGALAIIFYINSDYSYATKLGWLARRYGESNKVYDSIARQTANMNFINFIISDAYIETIIGNFKRSISPFEQRSILSASLASINIVGTYLILKAFINVKDSISIFALVTFISLILSNSSYRYLNVFMIPISIYYLMNGFKLTKENNV